MTPVILQGIPPTPDPSPENASKSSVVRQLHVLLCTCIIHHIIIICA